MQPLAARSGKIWTSCKTYLAVSLGIYNSWKLLLFAKDPCYMISKCFPLLEMSPAHSHKSMLHFSLWSRDLGCFILKLIIRFASFLPGYHQLRPVTPTSKSGQTPKPLQPEGCGAYSRTEQLLGWYSHATCCYQASAVLPKRPSKITSINHQHLFTYKFISYKAEEIKSEVVNVFF